jgi:Mg/Co/Ni transporter MgtE
MQDVRRRIRDDWDVCVVLNDDRVVLGILRAEQLQDKDDDVVEDVMLPGPGTFRPHVPIDEIAHYMIHHELENSLVTTSDGRLVGVLRQKEAARVAHELMHGQDRGDK